MTSPFRILQARAEACAILVDAGELELEEAMAPLRTYALDAGLVDRLGADGVMLIINDAFGIQEQKQQQDEDHER
jgi:hypothetical protein